MASLLVCALHLFLAHAKHMNLAPSVSIAPASITAKTATEITFQGVQDGDKVSFALECKQLDAPLATIQQGKARIALEDEAEKLKLCYQAAGKPMEELAVFLTVVPPSDTGAVTAITPSKVTQGEATSIELTGAAADSKAIFVPAREDCRNAEPSVSVSNGKGLFTITGVGGSYKLCYQAPGGSDSVEQNPETGAIGLKVLQVTTTGTERIESLSPTAVTSNVPTTISFVGAERGDKAKFVNAGSSSCEQETPPDKDVGQGHASFVLSGAGSYVLCYTAYGAADSVQQKDIVLTVKAAGAAQNMIGRWSSKNGNVDCGNLAQVPYCSSAGRGTCEQSYSIQSGIGYKCFWNKAVWPPFCDADLSTDEPGMICQSNSCGGSPSMCW